MKLFFLILLITGFSNASTLLVPEAQTSYEFYSKHCHSRDYVCSFDYFTRLLAEKPTPEFDKAMDEFDLNDKSSADNFRSRLIHILNTEELSTSQLQMLLKVMKDVNQQLPNVYFSMIENELLHLAAALQNPAPPGNEEFIFIFKKRYPLGLYRNLRTTILKIPLYLLHYASVPLKTNSREIRLERNISLLAGSCGSLTMTRPVSRIDWALLKSPACESKVTIAADFENRPEAHVHREFP